MLFFFVSAWGSWLETCSVYLHGFVGRPMVGMGDGFRWVGGGKSMTWRLEHLGKKIRDQWKSGITFARNHVESARNVHFKKTWEFSLGEKHPQGHNHHFTSLFEGQTGYIKASLIISVFLLEPSTSIVCCFSEIFMDWNDGQLLRILLLGSLGKEENSRC